MRGSSGALSTLITRAPRLASTHVHPPGQAPRSRHSSPGFGRTSKTVNASQSLRYARLGLDVRSSTKFTSPLGNALEHEDAASIKSGATRVQEPSGAAGSGLPKASGRADTLG